MTMGEWVDEWLTLRKRRLAPRTLEQYKDILRRYILPMIGGRDLAEVNSLDIEHLIAGAGEHERTAQLIYVLMAAILRAAYRLDLIDRNPCEKVDKPKHAPKITDWWTLEQLRDFLTRDSDDPYMLAWLLAAVCGLRRGELAGLRWQDIHGDTMHICNQRVRVAGQTIDTTPKTRTSDRWLPVPPIIRWYLDHQATTGEAYVLTDMRGRALEPVTLDHYWRAAQQRAGIDNPITLHGLRHTMASMAVAAGINPRELQPALGHASFTTTANIYSHIQQRQVNGAVLAVSRSVFGAG